MLRERVRNPSRKRVYVLIGNEPFSSCMERIRLVLDRGAEPHVQPLMKLNATEKRPWIRYDWTEESLTNVARWANRYLWRSMDFSEYERYGRRGQSEALRARSESLRRGLAALPLG